MRYKLYLIFLSIAIFSCKKDEEFKSRFIGEWKTIQTNIVTKDTFTTTITQGKEENIIVWNINGEAIELEFLNNQDTIAFQTNFSVPLFADNGATLSYVSKDTLDGSLSDGSIFLNYYQYKIYTLIRK